MDVISPDDAIREGQVSCGAGIFGHGAVETQIKRRANGRIDAHVAHGPADGNRIDAALLENVQQRRMAKGIGVVFDDNAFIISGSEG